MGIEAVYTDKLFQFVQAHLNDDPAQLVLKHHRQTDFPIKAAIHQIVMRQKAKDKLPAWTSHPNVIFPLTLSLEQCSSEQTAVFKARGMQGQMLIDLTGGFGVDTFFIGKNFQKTIYLERQEELVDIVRHNYNILEKSPGKFQLIYGDALNYLHQSNEQYDWVYVDPARRGRNDQKIYRLQHSEPDIVSNWGLIRKKALNIMIKASPMLDIKEALRELPEIQKVWIIAIKNEVKELLLIWQRNNEQITPEIRTFDLYTDGEISFSLQLGEEEKSESQFQFPGNFLIEPFSSILKAGAFKSFGSRFGLYKLHPNTHLYSIDRIENYIPGKIFKIVQEVKLNKKDLGRVFPGGTVNVMVRNHPLKAVEIKQRYRLKDGGEYFLIATTTMDGKARAYQCKLVQQVRSANNPLFSSI